MKAERKSQSSSREHHGRDGERSALDSKKKVEFSREISKESQESKKRKRKKETKSTLQADNQVHTSTVVDVDDVLSFEEGTELMTLLESEKQEEGKNPYPILSRSIQEEADF